MVFIKKLFLFVCIPSMIFGQNEFPPEIHLDLKWPSDQSIITLNETIYRPAEDAFVSVYMEFQNPNTKFEYISNGEKKTLNIDPHVSDSKKLFTTPIFITGKELPSVSIRCINVDSGIRIHFYRPLQDEVTPKLNFREDCMRPNWISHESWCANCRTNPSPVQTIPTHFVVHHSASANTSSNWPAVVRSFWDFHVNGRGWDDIGYNFLIDPEGQIYEGRGDSIRGAHFCGHNTNTLGICMIGTYTSVEPTPAALESLKNLLEYLGIHYQISLNESSLHMSSGKNLQHISGHRDGNCSTACPGDILYNLLPQIRIESHLGTQNCAEKLNLSAFISAPSEITANWDEPDQDIDSYTFLISSNSYNDQLRLSRNTLQTRFSNLQVQTYSLQVKGIKNGREVIQSDTVQIDLPDLSVGDLSIFPQPVDQQLNLFFNNAEVSTMNMYDIHGKLLFSQDLNEGQVLHKIDLNRRYPSGIYIIEVKDHHKSRTKKFLIQH